MKHLKFTGALVTAGLIALAAVPMASNAAVIVSASTSLGNQAYDGVGFAFHVNSTITVTQLGVFDSGADGIAGTAQLWATLFNATNGNVLAAMDFTQSSAGTLSNFFLYKQIGPITLAVGDYILAGYGWDANNFEFNNVHAGVNTTTFDPGGSGLVSFIDTRYGGGNDSHTVLPGNVYGPQAFDAVNMVFDAGSAVPEPNALALAAIALLGVGMVRRQRKH